MATKKVAAKPVPKKPAADKPAAKKPASGKPAAKKRSAAKPAAEVVVTKTARKPAPEASPKGGKTVAAAAAAPKKDKAKSVPPGPGAPKDRVLFPKDVYEANKDAIKAPLKAHGFAWQYLGEGKGRYHRDHVAIFVEFKDEGTDYHIRYTDNAVVDALLREWKRILGADAFAAAKREAVEAEQAEAAKAESEAVALWRLGEPKRREGEPETFYKRRLDEWLARKPA